MNKRVSIVIIAPSAIIVGFVLSASLSMRSAAPVKTVDTPHRIQSTNVEPSPMPQGYEGQSASIGSFFSTNVPNGWRASISEQTSFLGVQFARPGQIESLKYDPAIPAMIDHNGIPSWSGLTEHFYIRAITAPSQAFKPADHAEVTSEPFTFKDGTTGQKYKVTKHAEEARRWGGLLKDTEWYGRVYVYQKNGKAVEAHLAFYPSTKIDEAFFEKVAGSITVP